MSQSVIDNTPDSAACNSNIADTPPSPQNRTLPKDNGNGASEPTWDAADAATYGLPYLPNWKSTVVAPPRLLWTYERAKHVPKEIEGNKQKLRAWANELSTQHVFYCGFEGLNPYGRVTKDNPAAKCYALVADYDTPISQADIEAISARTPPEKAPNYVTKTTSGHARAIWIFEENFSVPTRGFAEEFLKEAKKLLLVEKLLPGLDHSAWKNPGQYFEIGSGWQQLRKPPLSRQIVGQIAINAAKRTKFGEELGEAPIPLSVVAEEVERKFPRRWTGPFEDGCRGVVFFDSASVNPTAAIVCPDGMLTFGQAQSFYTWRSIFGDAWTNRHTETRIADRVKDIWRTPNGKIWWPDGSAEMRCYTSEDTTAQLKFTGLNRAELDQANAYIRTHKNLDGVIPFLYRSEQIVAYEGRKFLNKTAKHPHAMAPADGGPSSYGEGFAFQAAFFDLFFAPTTTHRKYFTRDLWLAWFKRTWLQAWEKRGLEPGQALFLCGPVEAGKTYIAEAIIGRAMGGHADAGDYLTGGNFNKEMCEKGICMLSDIDSRLRDASPEKVAEKIKAIVSNGTIGYRVMYSDTVTIPHDARVIALMNDDQTGLRLLPQLGESLLDKFIIIRISDATRSLFAGRSRDEIVETTDRELPQFLRWLRYWAPPADVLSNRRYGVVSYIDEALRLKVLDVDGLGVFFETLQMHVHATAKTFVGTANLLYSDLFQNEATRPLIHKLNPVSLGKFLGKCADHPEYRSWVRKVAKNTATSGSCVWEIKHRAELG